ncbi:MAG: hypothetical protein HGA31_06120 [Candidatus Moranbacteria bacterium]|nr:hypothetical protein [Candidatus Moranbacteria bacterium]
MEQTRLMRQYPPSHIAKELRKRLPTQPEDALVLTENDKGEPIITGDSNVTRGYAIAMLAGIISDKCHGLWTSFDEDDIFRTLVPDSVMSDPTVPEEEKTSHRRTCQFVNIFILLLLDDELLETNESLGTEEDTGDFFPTDRLIEYVIKNYPIEPKD